MTYFSLRKHEPEPEPVEIEEEPEHAEHAEPEDLPAAEHGPLLTGLLGPGTWLAARFGTGVAWGVHAVSVWAVFFYGGWVAAGVIVAWVAAVLLFIPREFLERIAAAIERRSGHDTPATPPEPDEPPFDPLIAVLWHLIGDAPGAHLKTLTECLRQATPEEPPDRAAVRAKLTALDIPLRASVRDAAGRVNEGVHRDDLEAWEQTLPGPSPQAPSGARSGPVATAVTSGVGKRREAVATPLARLRRVFSRGAD